MVAISFLIRLIGILISVALVLAFTALIIYGIAWMVVGFLELAGYNNTALRNWLQKRLPKRKEKENALDKKE